MITKLLEGQEGQTGAELGMAPLTPQNWPAKEVIVPAPGLRIYHLHCNSHKKLNRCTLSLCNYKVIPAKEISALVTT